MPSSYNGGAFTHDSDEWHRCAFAMALFSGMIQLFMGFFRIGFVMNFISQPVISAFTSAAAVLIASTQVREHCFCYQILGIGGVCGGPVTPGVVLCPHVDFLHILPGFATPLWRHTPPA